MIGMGTSGGSPSAASARGGDTSIIPQGQTMGEYGNDPYRETKQSKQTAPTPLKP